MAPAMSTPSSSQSDFTTAAPRTFRLNAKKIFLTYPQFDLPLPEFLAFLRQRAPHPINQYVLCREEHTQTEGRHLHACVEFVDKINIRNPRHFDYVINEGRQDEERHHPNISTIRSWPNAVRYCKKDGDFLEDLLDDQPGARNQNNDVFLQAMAQPTREGYLEYLRLHAARDWTLFYERLEARANMLYRREEPPFQSRYLPSDFSNVPVAAREWADANLFADPKPDRPQSLLLVGNSRIGKTAWARSLGPHIYQSNYYNLDELKKADGDYVIFDDVPFERLPNYKMFLGCQQEITITDKYRPKTVLRNWSKPCIVCWNHNYYPTEEFARDSDWVEKNIVKVIQDTPYF